MGKNDFLTPKAIGNRIKAKGLQKLRWYCQLCQKQCRDENGFKCHQTSEAHRRQMEVFGQNPARVVQGYSEEFESDFLSLLKQTHQGSRVNAKVVYNEFIQDRLHVHMNSTKWLTLSEFVKYLGKTGKCKVEETPKGWFISLIQKDPLKELDDERRIRRATAEKRDEQRFIAAMEAQIERAKRAREDGDEDGEGSDEDASDEPEAKEFRRDNQDEPIKLTLMSGAAAAGGAGAAPAPSSIFGDDDDDDEEEDGVGASKDRGKGGMSGGSKRPLPPPSSSSSSRGRGGLADGDRSGRRDEGGTDSRDQDRDSEYRRDYWLVPDIVVKVMAKELDEHGYYKKKAVVRRVVDRYVGELEMLDSGDVLRVDQRQLETVLPAPGGRCLCVNGRHRGVEVEMRKIDVDRFRAQVLLLEGPHQGDQVWLEYEDVCKLH